MDEPMLIDYMYLELKDYYGYIEPTVKDPKRKRPVSVSTHAGYKENEISFHGDELDITGIRETREEANRLRKRLCEAGYLPSALLKKERFVEERPETWNKIKQEFNITSGQYMTLSITQELMNSLLNTRRARRTGLMLDRELYSKELKEDWMNNGFATSFLKDEKDLVDVQAIFGDHLGNEMDRVRYELALQAVRTSKDSKGGLFLGGFFFLWGVFALLAHWQLINYRELMRQRFKMASRMNSSEAPLTEKAINEEKNFTKFLLTYWEEDDDEEEEDEDEEEEEEEEEDDE
ncbi:set [Acrasis kona]|uniref:Set n=1 Tax=Acrasis kona TaxID=1008807 RepID=A0AAW2Z8Y6_9EUKA